MENKHLIIGTAGHVDHGKTAMIKALTGFDCDTHKQEKDRGITINLGFSHLDLPDGNSVGIIDVPGHADFIKTMVSGACGIDIVLLVISADEGIMPQTIEHLEIMKILGLKYGIIVLSKVDLVDEDLLELAEEEILEFVQGSFLENSAIIKFSATTNQGKQELLEALSDSIKDVPEKRSNGNFRMYVDRIFIKEGFGTIMNGSVLSGSISKNDPIFLLPQKKELRIRKMERHGKEVDSVKAGDRASFNLVGYKAKDFSRGVILSDKILQETMLLDVNLTTFQKDITLGLWSQVIFLHETNRLMTRIHLLDKNELKSAENCLAQIYLPHPIIAQYGDKFIIRNSSGNITLGGGQVIDPYPLHHRRRRNSQIEIVKKISSGEINELLAAEVRKSNLPITHLEVAQKLNLHPNELIDVIFQELPGDVIFYQSENSIILLLKKFNTKYQNKILTGLQEYHKQNPLKKTGKSFNELSGIFGNQQNELTKITLKQILQNLEEEQKLRKVEKTWVLFDFEVVMNDEINRQIETLKNYFSNSENKVKDFNEIIEFGQDKKIKEAQLKKILSFLVQSNDVLYLQQKYVDAEFYHQAEDVLVDFLKKNESGITVAQFRDLIKSNRSISLILLESFDDSGITVRKENNRFLTRKFLSKDKGET